MRSTLSVLLFVGVFYGVIIGVHLFLASALVLSPAWPQAQQTAMLWVLGALCVLMMANPMTSRRVPEPIARLIAVPSYLWMATAFYLLTLGGLSQFVLWLLPDVTDALRQQVASGVFGVATAIVAGGALSVARGPAIKRVTVELPRWPAALDGYRIVQISDVHIGLLLRRRFAQRLTERINGLDADLVAITGDLVDGSVDSLRDEVSPFSALRARDGVVFVTGNHDHYANAKAWCAELERLGIEVMRNRHRVVEHDGGRYVLAGVDDHSAGRDRGRGTVERALAASPADTPIVLLAHNPQSFVAARKHGVDLQLSGHTHGGQLWPFRYLVYLQTKWVAGLYSGRRSALYVSLGTGFWGPPVRVFAPAEITELVLRPA